MSLTRTPSSTCFPCRGALALALPLFLAACDKTTPPPPPAVPAAVLKAATREVPVLIEAVGRTEGSKEVQVLDAQRTVNDAELALGRNRQARLAYSVDLMKALGGGWAGVSVP